ncbi:MULTISPECIES: hypothetical protein [unclassified Pseudonocardia]|uniref:hypothetical protein n=1 Tax=unclassified Pseudonocardia TaxID=2619320 RepID=UPI001CF61DD9|nr:MULTISPECIES: hypothetical protein [unclassified Pseudonocardia]
MRRPARTRTLLGWIAVAFVGAWIVGTVTLIAAAGERGADDRAALYERGGAALRTPDGGGARLHELLLDAPDRGFVDDYVERLQAAGSPAVLPTGPDRVEVRSGPVLVTLSVTEEAGRWYFSLLPPGEREPG